MNTSSSLSSPPPLKYFQHIPLTIIIEEVREEENSYLPRFKVPATVGVFGNWSYMTAPSQVIDHREEREINQCLWFINHVKTEINKI